jgi:aerobic carbon-monoxide dehydrogenase small subunit
VMQSTGRQIKFSVNGEDCSVLVQDSWTLLYVLRDKMGLFGTKHGCGTGECGACTVLLNGKAVNSCLTLAVECEGAAVTTIEGLSTDGQLHPVQIAFIEQHATQCGFCTPGMILSTVALLGKNPNPTEEEIMHELVGNLCRCGAYPNIVKAAKQAAASYAEYVVSAA